MSGGRDTERERARAKRNDANRSAPQRSKRERGERTRGQNRLIGGGRLSALAGGQAQARARIGPAWAN
jgi:hypothetical protein